MQIILCFENHCDTICF